MQPGGYLWAFRWYKGWQDSRGTKFSSNSFEKRKWKADVAGKVRCTRLRRDLIYTMKRLWLT